MEHFFFKYRNGLNCESISKTSAPIIGTRAYGISHKQFPPFIPRLKCNHVSEGNSIRAEAMFNFPLSTEFKRQTKTSTPHSKRSDETRSRAMHLYPVKSGSFISFYARVFLILPSRARPCTDPGVTLKLTKCFIRLCPTCLMGP